jgi:hypothetical protein
MRPPGEWGGVIREVPVEIDADTRRAALRFLRGAAVCLRRFRGFGVRLNLPTATSPFPQAVAIDGLWTSAGWRGERVEHVLVGYLSPANSTKVLELAKVAQFLDAGLLRMGIGAGNRPELVIDILQNGD